MTAHQRVVAPWKWGTSEAKGSLCILSGQKRHSSPVYCLLHVLHTVLVYASDMLGQNLGERAGVAASFQRLLGFHF